MNVQIREAGENDFLAICELIKTELGYIELDVEQAISRFRLFNASREWCTYVAVNKNEVFGFIGITKGIAYEIEGESTKIMALAVSSKARRGGVGTQLLKQAEEWAMQNGITEIGLNSGMHRLEAHQFYEHNGYYKRGFSFRKSLEA